MRKNQTMLSGITEEDLNYGFYHFLHRWYRINKDYEMIEKYIRILELRLRGYTLETVGLEFLVNKERIRQIEAKGLELFKKYKKQLKARYRNKTH